MYVCNTERERERERARVLERERLTWKANCPEKSYIPQEYMRLSVFLTASALSTSSPVIGQIPPLANVAAMTLPDSHVTSIEHSYMGERKRTLHR